MVSWLGVKSNSLEQGEEGEYSKVAFELACDSAAGRFRVTSAVQYGGLPGNAFTTRM